MKNSTRPRQALAYLALTISILLLCLALNSKPALADAGICSGDICGGTVLTNGCYTGCQTIGAPFACQIYWYTNGCIEKGCCPEACGY